jgi:predicted SAM-dependent methyltransferase
MIMDEVYLNLGCGNIFIGDKPWKNMDWAPLNSNVIKANLLDSLKFEDSSVDLIYSSHFIEHIPIEKLPKLLKEYHRVLKSGGILRIVLPDFENIAREYVDNVDAGKHQKSFFNVIEMIDQCVRNKSGGKLSDFYFESRNNSELSEYIERRTGYSYKTRSIATKEFYKQDIQFIISRIRRRTSLLYINIIKLFLPRWYKDMYLSATQPGEKHHWVHDFYSISIMLNSAGFEKIYKMTSMSSNLDNFPFYPLDVNSQGKPLKGEESMYIEAIK